MPLRIIPEKDFLGRKDALTDLYQRVIDSEKGNVMGIFLSGRKGIGKTELLKHLFNHLFWKQDRIAPFYYSINSALLSAQDFSRDYLTRYICQRLAFERKESSLITLDGLSIEELFSISEERKAIWALEVLERFSHCHEPKDCLQIALSAPRQSTLATGTSAVIMIDEFHRLKDLRIGDSADPTLVSLFADACDFRKTQYLITGNQAEIKEMPFWGSVSQISLQPLTLEDSASMFSSILSRYKVSIEPIPYAMLNHLGGNPFYIRCIGVGAGLNKISEEKDLWRIYLHEVSEGNIYTSWTAVLKGFFPELELRGNVIELLNKIYHSGEMYTQRRINRILRMLSPGKEYVDSVAKALYLSGFVCGEFGVFRPPDDRVLIDLVDCMYMREILGKSKVDIENKLLEKIESSRIRGLTFELILPIAKEAELVAAQCLEQIGKNLHINQDVIGQLQMAVIEACINAIEHSKGEDRRIFLSFEFSNDTLEIGIESPGREFVLQGTDEPFAGSGLRGDSGRGWGIKLMKNFTDSVRFEKTERGTKVVLVKKNLKAETTIENKEGTTGSE